MSRIHDMDTTSNLMLMHLLDQPGVWSAWMAHAVQEAHEHSNGVCARDAKRVLGRQDYTFLSWVRNWVWERPFEVEIDGVVETWHWRLYVSKRGHTIEFENKGECHYNPSPRLTAAVRAGTQHFLDTWAKAAGWSDNWLETSPWLVDWTSKPSSETPNSGDAS